MGWWSPQPPPHLPPIVLSTSCPELALRPGGLGWVDTESADSFPDPLSKSSPRRVSSGWALLLPASRTLLSHSRDFQHLRSWSCLCFYARFRFQWACVSKISSQSSGFNFPFVTVLSSAGAGFQLGGIYGRMCLGCHLFVTQRGVEFLKKRLVAQVPLPFSPLLPFSQCGKA